MKKAITMGKLGKSNSPYRLGYSVCRKGEGYVGDVYRTGGMGRNARPQWFFVDTRLAEYFLGRTYNQMQKNLDAAINKSLKLK